MTSTAFKHPLDFNVLSKCSTSKARASDMTLPHSVVPTPVFMPVGTQGTLKGLLPEQVEELGCKIMLGNTYHLGHRPGPDLLDEHGGLHQFMKWNQSLLTDSGGFQMVSLLKLAEITEEGVQFQSPHDKSMMMLTPERSMQIQNSIGADIMMQLDDVVHSSVSGPRLEEAAARTTRWLDRCLAAHARPDRQVLFPIVQGGLNADLRRRCALDLRQRDVAGYAIGGLSGGEEKQEFWRMVHLSTDLLPADKPRYLMGVGFALDLVVCVALGCDMFDCVFPTRTARFGCALVATGQLNLKREQYARDFRPVDEHCTCNTCQRYTRAYLHALVTHEAVACQLLSVHNVHYQLQLMSRIRSSILKDQFPDFVRGFLKDMFPSADYPQWVVDALDAVGITVS